MSSHSRDAKSVCNQHRLTIAFDALAWRDLWSRRWDYSLGCLILMFLSLWAVCAERDELKLKTMKVWGYDQLAPNDWNFCIHLGRKGSHQRLCFALLRNVDSCGWRPSVYPSILLGTLFVWRNWLISDHPFVSYTVTGVFRQVHRFMKLLVNAEV